MRTYRPLLCLAAAFVAGLAWAQDGEGENGATADSDDLEAKADAVRREIKIIDLDASMPRFPALLEREKEYQALVTGMEKAAAQGSDILKMVERGRELKEAALKDLNEILRLHQGKYAGLEESEVWNRLHNARFKNVNYEEEWLVNILDDLEERVGINVELDARVYKFDTISLTFDRTSARAMLQMIGESLLFDWIVRGDTLYVYKERHEVLFGKEWLRQARAAFKARQQAIEKARKEAEKAALEGEDG